MNLQDLHEEIVWEDDEMALVLLEAGKNRIKMTLKGKRGQLMKDIDALAKKGIRHAGILGAYAHDHLKRYKNLKSASTRSLAFYARNVQEKRAYEKMIKQLTKGGKYRVVRSFPYKNAGRMYELRSTGKK